MNSSCMLWGANVAKRPQGGEVGWLHNACRMKAPQTWPTGPSTLFICTLLVPCTSLSIYHKDCVPYCLSKFSPGSATGLADMTSDVDTLASQSSGCRSAAVVWNIVVLQGYLSD